MLHSYLLVYCTRISAATHTSLDNDSQRRITDIYEVDEGAALGEGIQGIVRTITHKKTGVKYAMKTVPLGAGKVREELFPRTVSLSLKMVFIYWKHTGATKPS